MTETLDIGCGENKRGTLGVDIKRSPNLDLLCDAHYLPFQNMCCDGCFAYALLEHVNDPVRVLTEVHRVLKNDSWLKILVPTDSRLESDYLTRILSFDFKGLIQEYRAMKSGEHRWQFSERNLKRILRKMPFIIDEVDYPSFPICWGRKGMILSKFRLVRHPHMVISARKVSSQEAV